MDDASHRRLELAATVLLAMAAVATAWAAYQSARWHSEQAKGQSASIAARVESTRAADVANRQAQIDVALFTQWVDAYATDKTELARFYRKRFRPEFRPAFVAWVATKPRTNPNAPAVAVRHAPVQARGQRDGRGPRRSGRRRLRERGELHRASRRLLAGRCAVRRVAVLRGHQHPAPSVPPHGWSSSVSAMPCSSAA